MQYPMECDLLTELLLLDYLDPKVYSFASDAAFERYQASVSWDKSHAEYVRTLAALERIDDPAYYEEDIAEARETIMASSAYR